MKKTIDGFTIVKLLIAIVVIAILAATSIVAYTRIQNCANSATIQSDLSSLAKKYALFHAGDETSNYQHNSAELFPVQNQ